eukprot:6183313-Pleurochrysis_carterae.AAC.2
MRACTEECEGGAHKKRWGVCAFAHAPARAVPGVQLRVLPPEPCKHTLAHIGWTASEAAGGNHKTEAGGPDTETATFRPAALGIVWW